MIAILYNLIYLPMLVVSLALSNLILILKTYAGFVIIFSTLAFLEYATIKSIVKNKNIIDLKPVFNYMKNYKPRDVSLISPQWAVLDIILKEENICIKEISNSIGIAIGTTGKLISDLVKGGYITSKSNGKNIDTSCYRTYEPQLHKHN
jgi:hypothetical protein